MGHHIPRKPRFVVNRQVRFHAGSVTADGMVVDLHETGARLDAPTRLEVGQTLSLTLSDATVEARVIWCKDNAVGLSFAAPIPEDLVASLHADTEGWILV